MAKPKLGKRKNAVEVFKDLLTERGLLRPRTRIFKHLHDKVVVKSRYRGLSLEVTKTTTPGHLGSPGLLGQVALETWREAAPDELLRFSPMPAEKKWEVLREFIREVHPLPISEQIRQFWMQRLVSLQRYHEITALLTAGHRPRRERIRLSNRFRELFFAAEEKYLKEKAADEQAKAEAKRKSAEILDGVIEDLRSKSGG